MIPFKKLTLGEKPKIARFIVENKEEKEIPQLLVPWMDDEDTYYAIVENLLIFRRQGVGQYIFSMPYGNGLLRYVLMQILEDSTIMGVKCVITGIEKDQIRDINTAMPNHFEITEENSEMETYKATSIKNFSHSVFNNNESMVPPPTGSMFK